MNPTAELPFDKVANDPRVAFAKSDGNWNLVVRRYGADSDGATVMPSPGHIPRGRQ